MEGENIYYNKLDIAKGLTFMAIILDFTLSTKMANDLLFSEEMWRKRGINKVSTYPILYSGFFLLSHEPLYFNKEMPYVNLFGNVHKSPLYSD